MILCVGIDTSCYTTSVAACDEGGVILSNRLTLPVAPGERGLRQSEAVFAHIKQLPGLYADAMQALQGRRVDAVCVSARPRDEAASYMPVFLAGVSFARVAAASFGCPVYETTHQRGHIRAAMPASGISEGAFIALHLSGGTTEALLMDGSDLRLLCGTKDLHAGQLIDRVGVALGLPFPAGPHLEALAAKGKADSRLPVSMAEGNCHFSGAENRAMGWIRAGDMPPEDIASEVFSLITRTVLRMLTHCASVTGVRQALLTGGVASSQLFRDTLLGLSQRRRAGIALHFGQREYAGDNAAGVALLGLDKLTGRRAWP